MFYAKLYIPYAHNENYKMFGKAWTKYSLKADIQRRMALRMPQKIKLKIKQAQMVLELP